MKIGVMGAGAVGCYYGGMLARAGHQVILIGRQNHVEAIRQQGLFLETLSFREHLSVEASTDAKALRDAQLILCCVKSTDSEQAAMDLASHIEPSTILLSLQNGVDNAERLQALLPCHVSPAVVYVATEMAAPGHVRHHGRGELVLERRVASPRLTALFADAGIPVEISDNVIGALWAKLILNCAYNALSAISRLPYGLMVQGEGIEDIMRDVVHECLAIAQAVSIEVPGDTWKAVQRIARTMPSQLSSTAQDLVRGKRSEIDFLNGYIVRKGTELGIATPVNRVLHSLVKLLEAGITNKHVHPN